MIYAALSELIAHCQLRVILCYVVTSQYSNFLVFIPTLQYVFNIFVFLVMSDVSVNMSLYINAYVILLKFGDLFKRKYYRL